MNTALNVRTRIILAAAIVALLALPFIANWLDSPFYVRFATRILIFAIAAVSLDLVLGYGGLVSFGHAAYMGLGAYVVGILSFHAANEPLTALGITIAGTHNALIAWPLAMLVGAGCALVIGAISLRTKGIYFIMITLAFAQMLYYFFLSLTTYGGDEGLRLAQRSELLSLSLNSRTTFYYVVLACLVGCLILARRVVHSKFGFVLRGAKQNERRMRSIGYNTYGYRLVAFTMSGAMAGLAGVLMVNNESFVSTADLHWLRSADLLIIVVLGGAGTLFGPVLGAALWLLLEFFLEGMTAHWHMILGPVLIATVLFAKRGLWSMLAGERDKDG